MRILYISHLHPPPDAPLENMGGMQRVSMQLVRELEKREDIQLFTEVMHTSWRNAGIMTARFLLRLVFRLPRIAKECNADIILFSSMVTASLARFTKRRIDIPMVTINHGRDVTLPNPVYQRFVPGIFNALDSVISVSEATRQACIERGMDPNDGIALPNGVDLENLKVFPEKDSSRAFLEKQFEIPLQGNKLLLTVGRMVKRKGHAWFIQNVLPRISKEAVYVAVGDGPEFSNIKQVALESGERDNIFLLGRQPDDTLKKVYSAADLFIMPNIPVEGDMEGFGIVMLEANMSRTPVVASDLEGIKDVIEQGENGFRVPPLQPEMFAAKVDEVLRGDLGSLPNRARQYVEDHFSWDRVADRYIEHLKRVIVRVSVTAK